MEERLVYESPKVEIIEIEVEKGFANSDGSKNTEEWKEKDW